MMKTNKVTKLGISLLSVAALGVVAPDLTNNPVFGVSIVKAEEQQKPLKYRIDYIGESGEKVAPSEFGVLNPGETVNIYKDIEGHEVVSRFEWLPGYNMDYDTLSTYSGFVDGYNYMYLKYKKLDPAPAPTPKPEVKPETKPSETPKPEVKSETKPSETPKPEVKPEPAPKEEKQEPLKYRIDYFDADTGEEISREYGALNPGETINIHKNIDGYEVVSNYSWMPGYNVDYQIMSTYFGGTMDEHYMFLDYKKVNADAKPSETPKPEVKPEPKPSDTPKPEVKPAPKPSETPKPEVKPEPKPSETPKPEVKPETKPSETPKPEVKPETKPSETPKPEVKPSEKPDAEAEEQEPIKYRIRYLDEHSREIASMETGVLNPGESINIHKDIEGYQVVSNFSWMPGYNLTHDIASTFFYGAADGYREGYLRYKKLDADVKPSEETKPDVKPSEQPKQEAKPEPKPSETPKPEVKPSEKPVDKPETNKPTTKPQTGLNNAPTAPINPVGQDSNTKADKPVSKTETTALPNTGEQNSILGFAGFLLASLGLAGLTYKGRH